MVSGYWPLCQGTLLMMAESPQITPLFSYMSVTCQPPSWFFLLEVTMILYTTYIFKFVIVTNVIELFTISSNEFWGFQKNTWEKIWNESADSPSKWLQQPWLSQGWSWELETAQGSRVEQQKPGCLSHCCFPWPALAGVSQELEPEVELWCLMQASASL